MSFFTTKSIIPVGTVFSFAGTTAPDGWLMCDGSSVSQTTYAALYAVIGTTHGQTGGASTFNIPDYRGRFLRGTDDMGTVAGAAGRDPDKSARTSMNTGGQSSGVGSVQNYGIADHEHYFYTMQDDGANFNGVPLNGNLGLVKDNGTQYGWQPRSYANTGVGSVATDNNAVNKAYYANENRPTNAYINYIIKI